MKKLVVRAYSMPQMVFALERYAKLGWKLTTTNEDFPRHIGSEYRLTFVKDEVEQKDGFHYIHTASYFEDGAWERDDVVNELIEPVKETVKRGPGRPASK